MTGSSTRQGAAETDWLSALPDDVLVLILDKIPLLRDAVQTSILSRRWRNLPGLLSEIVLDVDDFEPEYDGYNYTLEELMRPNASVVEATKSILAHKSQRTISNLSVRFYYLRDESIDIVRAVDGAMANREVMAAEFDILPEIPVIKYCEDTDLRAYGRLFMTSFDTYPRAFAGLTSLHMQSLRLGESDFPNVLRTCKKLEHLSLFNCYAGSQSALHIEHAQLVVLCIDCCRFQKVEFKWLPRLTHLTVRHWLPSGDQYPFSLGYVPQLWMLHLTNAGSTLDKTFKFRELLSNVTTIGELTLNFMCNRIWIQPESSKLLAPLLRNLQVVQLFHIHEVFDIAWTMFFLEAAALLKEISIQVSSHECFESEEDEYKEHDDYWRAFFQKSSDHLSWEARSDFKHYYLNKLSIEGFEVEERLTRYVRHIAGVAVNLKRLSLLENRPCTQCQFRPSKAYPRTEEERDQIRKQISELRSSPVTIEFDLR